MAKKNLQLVDAINENLKLVRDEDGTYTPIELSTDKLKVNGDLEATGYIDNIKLRKEAIIKADGNVTIDSGGDLTIDVAGGQCIIVDDTIGDPDLVIKSTSDDVASGNLHFIKDRDGANTDGDLLGTISFRGYDTSTNLTLFAEIKGYAEETSNDAPYYEEGSLRFYVVNLGALREGLKIQARTQVASTVDVDIGMGTDSLTTIAGDLDVDKIISNGIFTIDTSYQIVLDSNSGDFRFYDAGDSDDYFKITVVGGTGATTLETVSAAVPGDGHLLLKADGDLTLSSNTGKFKAHSLGAEFSAADSAYAGMILGYTCIGADVAVDTYILTLAYVCFLDSGGTAISVTFTTPPSELVEIEVDLFFSSGSGAADLELSISNNASYASNTLHHPLQHERTVCEPARGNGGTFTQKWLLAADELANPGASNTIYIAAGTDSTLGTPVIKWGGWSANDPTNLVMKATALPATIGVGS